MGNLLCGAMVNYVSFSYHVSVCCQEHHLVFVNVKIYLHFIPLLKTLKRNIFDFSVVVYFVISSVNRLFVVEY